MDPVEVADRLASKIAARRPSLDRLDAYYEGDADVP